MSEFVTGIKPVTPSYPLRPPQPASKDREPGGDRKKPREPRKNERTTDGDDGGDKPTIDEHV